MRITKCLIICLLCSGLVFGAQAQSFKEGTPGFKDILELKSPRSVSISPDGKYILYSVFQPNWEKNDYISQIWMILVRTGEIKQMTYADASSKEFAWSPDSRHFAFLSKRDKKTQLYLMSPTGGEARKISDLKTGINSYRWSPDSSKIAYLASDEKKEKEKDIEKKYGSFDIIDTGFNMTHLWLLDIESGKSEKIIEKEDLNISQFSWSPNGKKIAFSAEPDTRIISFSKSDIYIFELESKKVTPLVTQPGPDGQAVWSPDGTTILFTSSMGSETYFVNNELCTIPAEGGKITCLTKQFDENINLYKWNDRGIFFTAYQGMSRHLFRLDPQKGTVDQVTKGSDFILAGLSMDHQARQLAMVYSNSRNYPEIYITPLKKIKPRKLTNFSKQLAKWKMATKEKISWKSTDGVEITGVLIKPADFDPNKKYPLFVIIHGGPTGISLPQKFDRYNRYYPIEQWAAKGAVFLEPNYRGSAGFGAEFRKLNYRNLGVGDYWDVISGVDHLIAQGFVDKEKVASMGWSQGGYISAYITTFSKRFKAVSVGAGISDWITYYYRTDITPFTVHYLGATPWKDPEIYKKTSPMTYINKAQTPTLIQHGEFDRRVPTTNAYKLYRGLQDRGIPSKLIIYKGFGHGITKPKENLAVLTHNWQWFNEYIYGEKPEEEVMGEKKTKTKDK